MKNEWILDVLADLKAFAQSNGMPVLAEQLEDTALLAAAEIASDAEGLPGDATPATRKHGQDPSELGTGL